MVAKRPNPPERYRSHSHHRGCAAGAEGDDISRTAFKRADEKTAAFKKSVSKKK